MVLSDIPSFVIQARECNHRERERATTIVLKIECHLADDLNHESNRFGDKFIDSSSQWTKFDKSTGSREWKVLKKKHK